MQKNDRFEGSEINKIANMAFIGGKTNRSISNKRPEVYIPMIAQEKGWDDLLAQKVLKDDSLIQLDNFKDFLIYRRSALADAVNSFIANAVSKGKATEFK